MKVGLIAIGLLVLAGCQGAGGRASYDTALATGPINKIDVGPIAKPRTNEPVTVDVEHDQFAASTSYIVTPSLQQPMAGEDALIASWGRSVTTLMALSEDGKSTPSYAARVRFQHKLTSWMFPRRAADENGKALEGQRLAGDVTCDGRCEYDEKFYVLLNGSDLRQASAAGRPYRLKIYGDGRQEIIEIPADYIRSLLDRVPAGTKGISTRSLRT